MEGNVRIVLYFFCILLFYDFNVLIEIYKKKGLSLFAGYLFRIGTVCTFEQTARDKKKNDYRLASITEEQNVYR